MAEIPEHLRERAEAARRRAAPDSRWVGDPTEEDERTKQAREKAEAIVWAQTRTAPNRPTTVRPVYTEHDLSEAEARGHDAGVLEERARAAQGAPRVGDHDPAVVAACVAELDEIVVERVAWMDEEVQRHIRTGYLREFGMWMIFFLTWGSLTVAYVVERFTDSFWLAFIAGGWSVVLWWLVVKANDTARRIKALKWMEAEVVSRAGATDDLA